MNIIKMLLIMISFISFMSMSHASMIDSITWAKIDSTGKTFFRGGRSSVGFSPLSSIMLPKASYFYKDYTSRPASKRKFNHRLGTLVASASSFHPSYGEFEGRKQSHFLKERETNTANTVSTVPLPAAGILFASALFGVGLFGRRKKKSAETLVVGAFTRTS